LLTDSRSSMAKNRPHEHLPSHHGCKNRSFLEPNFFSFEVTKKNQNELLEHNLINANTFRTKINSNFNDDREREREIAHLKGTRVFFLPSEAETAGK